MSKLYNVMQRYNKRLTFAFIGSSILFYQFILKPQLDERNTQHKTDLADFLSINRRREINERFERQKLIRKESFEREEKERLQNSR